MKRRERAEVVSLRCENGDIFSIYLKVSFASEVRPGQFVSLFVPGGRNLLPRPLSVAGADPERGIIRIVFRIAGEGTLYFSKLSAGDGVDVMGPLGNGFPLEAAKGKRLALAGGGIGIPPLLFCADAMVGAEDGPSETVFAAGYRDSGTYLLDELERSSRVIVTTDDGSLGIKGNVTDALRSLEEQPEVIFACGPKPMLRAVRDYAKSVGAACYISMEEHMACGVGVCLGCVTATADEDPHSMVKNTRICADGPVFEASLLDLS